MEVDWVLVRKASVITIRWRILKLRLAIRTSGDIDACFSDNDPVADFETRLARSCEVRRLRFSDNDPVADFET